MFSRLSLKYRIAATVIVLVAIVLGLALERTLSTLIMVTKAQRVHVEHVTLLLLQEPSRQALLTEEYAPARQAFTQTLEDPFVHRVLLADASNRVVLSTTPADIGSPLPALPNTAAQQWRTLELTHTLGKLGTLALAFSTTPLLQTQRTARNLGVGIAAIGMLLIALVGLGMGFLLTRRLHKLTQAAQRLAAGEEGVVSGLTGQDEVAQVGQAFDAMARQIATDRQRLEERDARTRAILETTVDGIITIDERGAIESFNPAAAQLFGYTAAEVLGRNIMMLMPSPYREAHDGYLAHYCQTGERKIIGIGREVTGQRQDGTTFAMDLAISEVLLDGQRLFTGIVRDITARKRAEAALRVSEEKFRNLVEGSIQAILIQRDFKPLYANQALADLHGYATPDDILRLDSTLRLLAPHERARARQHLQGTTAPRRHEVQALRQDGAVLWMDALVSMVDWGNAPAMLLTAFDITERKHAEEALQQAHDDLEQRVQERTADLIAANEEVRRFTYIVSHDLRAPLINLKGFAAELRQACATLDTLLPKVLPHLDEPERAEVANIIQQDGPEALSFIDSSVTRMNHLIEAVLRLSRAGRRELHIEQIHTEALVHEIVQSLTHQLTERQVQLTIGALPDLQADRTSMEQVFANLLNNAVKYLEATRPGAITVTAEQHADFATFHIQDNGRGIAEEDIPRVFELFRRVGQQDTVGEGMGLTYVQTLVRRHGGDIWCRSTVGIGTTFTFTISNHQDAVDEPQLKAPGVQ